MPRKRRALVVLLWALTATACAGLTSDQAAEVARTWEAARIYLPGAFTYHRPATVPAPAGPVATVLFLHACAGLYGHDDQWASALTGAGYAVVMPDSFARQYRPRGCDPQTLRGFRCSECPSMRQEEIAHALSHLRRLAWVDQRNIFLMGHSEGGTATALWDKPGARATTRATPRVPPKRSSSSSAPTPPADACSA